MGSSQDKLLHATVQTSASCGDDDSGMESFAAEDGERAWWQQLRQQNDDRAREQLVARYLPYARTVAAIYYARRTHDDVEFAEYFQLASVGLVEAMERYDPGFGAQFKTFAARRMHGAILNGLERITEKNQQIAIRKKIRQERLQALKSEAGMAGEFRETDLRGLPVDAPHRDKHGQADSQQNLFRYLAEVGMGLALGVLLGGTGMMETETEGESTISPEVSYFRQTEIRQLRDRVQAAVGDLSQQEQMVIRYHYLQDTSFDEIASMMGITRGRISQIHRKALIRMRDILARVSCCDVSW